MKLKSVRNSEYVDKDPVPIRIWTFNNPINGIADQLEFAMAVLKLEGFHVTISKRPCPKSLNIVIENIQSDSYQVINDFCESFNKKIAIIMTEHIDYVENRLFFHGKPFEAPTEYMHKYTRKNRFLHLLLSTQNISFFLRLGDLPSLDGLGRIFLNTEVRTLPFPPIRNHFLEGEREYDFIFSGFLTKYRKEVFSELKAYKTLILPGGLSRKVRDKHIASASFVLNVPQDAEWGWVSTMRVLSAWRNGIPVLNIGPWLDGLVYNFCTNLSDTEENVSRIVDLLDDPKLAYQTQVATYNRYVSENQLATFPWKDFCAWAAYEL